MGGIISLILLGRNRPEQTPPIGTHRNGNPVGTNFADDYLTEEQMQFVKDNMYSFRKTRRSENLDFYKNKIKSKPAPGHTIVELLNMKGNYDLLDNSLDQSSLQWLFPIPDSPGKNAQAQPLQLREIRAIKSNKTLKGRFLAAYVMMLDFYGMRLSSDITGEVSRGPSWENRYKYLNSGPKHHMRITRILISLGCFGFAHFQFPWIAFMLNEIFGHNTLQVPMTSVKFWIETISDDDDKAACTSLLGGYTTSVEPVYLNECRVGCQGVRNADLRNQSDEWRNDHLTFVNDNNQGPLFPTAQPLVDLAVFSSGDFLTDDEFASLGLPTYFSSIEEGNGNPILENLQTNEDHAESSTHRTAQSNEGKCKVCMDEPIQVAFFPCAHAVACRRCSNLLQNCVVCRKEIQDIMQIYLS